MAKPRNKAAARKKSNLWWMMRDAHLYPREQTWADKYWPADEPAKDQNIQEYSRHYLGGLDEFLGLTAPQAFGGVPRPPPRKLRGTFKF